MALSLVYRLLGDVFEVAAAPYFQEYGQHLWAAVGGCLDAVADAAADVFTAASAFSILESIRLDRSYGVQVHP